MALVKYGGGIVQQSGSMAGNTYARNRFGNYVRARTKPINPRSSRQSAARINMMMLAEQWRETPMTDEKRTAWQVYANSVNWLNKLGETVTLTGFNHFIRSNAALLTAGGVIVTDGPTDLGLPGGDPVLQVTDLSAALQSAKITFDDTMEWCDEDNAWLYIEMGEPQNATRNFFNGPWRFWDSWGGDVAVPPVSPLGPIANLPWAVAEGQKVWWRAHIIRDDGRKSSGFECDPGIGAA